ncbi:MAG: hypothetical protein ACRDTP_12560 [Mycobacteriales bacterium]
MRTNRITLAAAAGATLAAGIATPAAAHTADHHHHATPTLASSQAWLAASTAREEAFLTRAKAWVAGSSALDQTEKDALTAQLNTALAAITSAASEGAAATTVQDVSTADDAAHQAFWGTLRKVFAESATITSAEHEAATVSALRARLASLVAQYTAHDLPASPWAAEADGLLTTAAADTTTARAAAISDPSAATRDLAAARADARKAVADIAAAAHAFASALRAAAPTTTTKPVARPVTLLRAKAVSDPTSTRPCAGHHVAFDTRTRSHEVAYSHRDHRGDGFRHSSRHHGGDHHRSGGQERQASFHH